MPDNYVEEKPDGVENPHDEDWTDLSYQQQYYLVHREEKNRKTVERKREIQAWLEDKKRKVGCSRCDENHPACIDFHHVGEKSSEVSQMVRDGYSKESIEEEIEECIPLCANCHRKEHHR